MVTPTMPQFDEENLRQINEELTRISDRLTRMEERLLILADRLADGAHAASVSQATTGAPSDGQFQDTLTRLLLGNGEGA